MCENFWTSLPPGSLVEGLEAGLGMVLNGTRGLRLFCVKAYKINRG